MTLWGNRFSQSMDPLAWNMNSSLAFDRRLAKQDVAGSIAWVSALQKAGVLTNDESVQMISALQNITSEFETDGFVYLDTDEDIHTAVERRLGELIGPLAGKLHTGRSRNDQVATDFRLWMMQAVPVLDKVMQDLQKCLVDLAEKNIHTIMPGYTHLQRAQPVTLAHWLLSFFWMLQRDRGRLKDLHNRLAVMPLGSGALAGTAFPIDRISLAEELGFDSPGWNSIDAVSDRDFAVEYLFCCALTGVHISKLAENVVLFTTKEFGFFKLTDEYSTGSSLMPQKRNPDPFELARGKSGTLLGLLTGLMATLKGLPSTYDKDLQEDKLPVFQATDILLSVLPVLTGAISKMYIDKSRMLASIDPGMMATDLADELVRNGTPFREAHALVGKAMKYAEENSLAVNELTSKDWDVIGISDIDINEILDPGRSIERHNAIGGTAPRAVLEQINKAREVCTGL